MKERYDKMMGQLRLDPETRAAMLERLTQDRAAPRKGKGRRALPGRALLVACIVAALTVSALAVGLPVLREHFGGGAGYEQSSVLVGRSVTSEGWTMTLTDCVGDERYMVLGFTLEAPAGTALDQKEEYCPGEYQVKFPKEVGVRAKQWRQLADDDPADNRLQLGLWIENIQDQVGEPGLNGQPMRLRVERLQYPSWDPEAGDWKDITVSDGVWDFGTLTLEYPDHTLRLKPNAPVTVLGVPATITHLEVSPIGVDVWFEGDALKGHDGWFPWPGQCINEPEITLYDKRGNALEPDKHTPFGIRGGSGCNGNPNVTEEDEGPFILNIIQSYGYLLDMDQLDHIDICGVSISLT